MILHHLHVHQRGSAPIRNRDAIAGTDQRIGAWLENAPQATGCNDHGLGLEQRHEPGSYFKGHDPSALPMLVLDQRQDEPLFKHRKARLHDLLIQDVQQGLAGKVGNEKGAGAFLTAEATGPQPPVFVPVKDHAHVFQGQNVLPGLLRQNFHGILVA